MTRPVRLRGGVIAQSGIGLRNKHAQNPHTPRRSHYRALVVNTNVTDEQDEFGPQYAVECDVILVSSGERLMNVQVMQSQHGINNVHDLWIPRASTRVISGNSALNLTAAVSRRGTRIGPITPLDDTDGDMVVVSFLEGRPDWPLIVGALPHQRTNRVVIAGDGWAEGSGADQRGVPEKNEYYVHHNGAEIRVNGSGEVLIDTVGAYTDESTEDASGDVGQVRIRVKEADDTSVRFTVAIGDDDDVLEVFKDGAQLRIDLGAAADEQLVLGNQLSDFIRDEVATKVNTFWSAVYATHKHSIPMAGTTGPPDTPQTETIANLPTSALSDLAYTKKT
jgi:hypothetical protein